MSDTSVISLLEKLNQSSLIKACRDAFVSQRAYFIPPKTLRIKTSKIKVVNKNETAWGSGYTRMNVVEFKRNYSQDWPALSAEDQKIIDDKYKRDFRIR